MGPQKLENHSPPLQPDYLIRHCSCSDQQGTHVRTSYEAKSGDRCRRAPESLIRQGGDVALQRGQGEGQELAAGPRMDALEGQVRAPQPRFRVCMVLAARCHVGPLPSLPAVGLVQLRGSLCRPFQLQRLPRLLPDSLRCQARPLQLSFALHLRPQGPWSSTCNPP